MRQNKATLYPGRTEINGSDINADSKTTIPDRSRNSKGDNDKDDDICKLSKKII
jgi:hypothetical protein